METYKTELGYEVRETIDGLDVSEDGEFVCELPNKTLADYRYHYGIDDDKLEADIKEEVDTLQIMARIGLD